MIYQYGNQNKIYSKIVYNIILFQTDQLGRCSSYHSGFTQTACNATDLTHFAAYASSITPLPSRPHPLLHVSRQGWLCSLCHSRVVSLCQIGRSSRTTR